MCDIKLIEKLLKSAGRIAMRHFGKVTPTLKEDQSCVTEADLAVQDYLKAEFERRFPEDGIIAEERNLAKEPSAGERRWIIDPIDGTAAFIRGLPAWGIALGLLEGSQPVGGFFYMPVTRDYFSTIPDGTVHKNGTIIRMMPPQPFSRETVLLVDGRFHNGFSISQDYQGKLRSMGSTVAHLCYVAAGGAEAAFLMNVNIWDIAAGCAMLNAQQGIMEYFDGTPVLLQDLFINTKAPKAILSGHPDTVEQFREFISAL